MEAARSHQNSFLTSERVGEEENDDGLSKVTTKMEEEGEEKTLSVLVARPCITQSMPNLLWRGGGDAISGGQKGFNRHLAPGHQVSHFRARERERGRKDLSRCASTINLSSCKKMFFTEGKRRKSSLAAFMTFVVIFTRDR